MSQTPELTLFYDGQCPLCVAEMKRLQQLDQYRKLHCVELQDADTMQLYPTLDREKAMTILHGRLANGEMIEGLDVTHKAWSLVGKGRLTAITRLPVIRWGFDVVYLIFAKHRYKISGWLTGQRYTTTDGIDCQSCRLSAQSKPTHPKTQSRM